MTTEKIIKKRNLHCQNCGKLTYKYFKIKKSEKLEGKFHHTILKKLCKKCFRLER